MIDSRRCLTLVLVGLLFAAFSCGSDPRSEAVTCEEEGAEQDGRACVGGVWVRTGDAPSDAGSDACPDCTDASDASGDGSCVPENPALLCEQLGYDCGQITTADSCGNESTVDCGECTDPEVCGGGGTPNVCGCEAESNEAFCDRLVATCGSVTAPDNCGTERTVDCGSCTAPATCGGGGTDNVCACPDQTDDAFCASYGAECGTLEAEDACGQIRKVDCGSCADPETCGGGGTDNQCGCGSDADLCAALGLQCGIVDVSMMCGNKASIDCGGCDPNGACGSNNMCECNAGYVGDGTSCMDIDECANATHDCDANATCENTEGSFACSCNAGYVGNGKMCTDVDECADGTHSCDVNASCTNEPGGYSCTCASGYEGTGQSCTDIDECADGTDSCDVNAACTNEPGGYSCTCDTGYEGDGFSCIDLDECADGTDSCDANATCTNEPGSYTCTCDTGYEGDGFSCTDIDECADGTDTCDANATCTNEPGGYSCTCDSGFEGDGFSCTDIDECAEGTDSCHVDATCTNTVGSYECTCNAGYVGDGFNCTPAESIVSSVQKIELTLPDSSTTASVQLATKVNAARAVPFVSLRADGTGAEPHNVMTDVWVTTQGNSSTVHAERAGNLGEVTLVVTVVEFDPSKVEVQSGTFDMLGSTLESETLATTVDRSASFLLFNYRYTGSGQGKRTHMVAGRIEAAGGAVEFERHQGDADVFGHYWVVSALNSEFSVEHASATILPGTGVTTTALTGVGARDKSFLVYSHRTNVDDASASNAHAVCELNMSLAAECWRHGTTNQIDLEIQVVTMAGGEVVTHGTFSMSSGTVSTSQTLSTLSSTATMWVGHTGISASYASQTTSTQVPGTFTSVELDGAPPHAVGTRGAPNNSALEQPFQVIEW